MWELRNNHFWLQRHRFITTEGEQSSLQWFCLYFSNLSHFILWNAAERSSSAFTALTAALCLRIKSLWYFPGSLMRWFGQVKKTPQQIWSPEKRPAAWASICCCYLVEVRLSTSLSPGIGNGHRQGTASPDIHSSCRMSRLIVRHSRHLGEKVMPCQQLEESLRGEVRVCLKKPPVMLLLACFGCSCDSIKLGFHWQVVYV